MTSEESLEIATKAGFSGSTFAKGLGIGLAGAVANIGISTYVKRKEDELYDETVNFQFDLWKNSLQNGNMKLLAERK